MIKLEEYEDTFWLLYEEDAEGRPCLVGELYPRGPGFRWHHKLTDWRQMEETEEAAIAALLKEHRRYKKETS